MLQYLRQVPAGGDEVLVASFSKAVLETARFSGIPRPVRVLALGTLRKEIGQDSDAPRLLPARANPARDAIALKEGVGIIAALLDEGHFREGVNQASLRPLLSGRGARFVDSDYGRIADIVSEAIRRGLLTREQNGGTSILRRPAPSLVSLDVGGQPASDDIAGEATLPPIKAEPTSVRVREGLSYDFEALLASNGLGPYAMRRPEVYEAINEVFHENRGRLSPALLLTQAVNRARLAHEARKTGFSANWSKLNAFMAKLITEARVFLDESGKPLSVGVATSPGAYHGPFHAAFAISTRTMLLSRSRAPSAACVT